MKRGTRDGAGGGRASRRLGRERRGVRGGSWLRRLQLATGVIVVVSASLLAAWGLRRYLRSSPRFAIRTVRIDGNHRRTAHQIAQRGAVALGANILSIDEHAAAAAIAADPWIASATVHTELPSTVVVTVVEREARALAVLQGKLFLVDADGEVFKARGPGEPQALPIITGLDPQRLLDDREGAADRLRHALELAADIEAMGLSKRYPLQEVHLEVDGAITAVIGSDAVSLRLGMAPYRAKLLKAKRLLAETRYRKAKAAVLFLDNRAHPERVVVRMR